MNLNMTEHIHSCPYCPPSHDEWRHIGNGVTMIAGVPRMQHIDHGTDCDGEKHSICPECRQEQVENIVKNFVASHGISE